VQKIQKIGSQFRFRGKVIEYVLWSNVASVQKPDVVIMLGAGQVGALPRIVAKRAGPGVVVIGGVPHWHADPSAQDIEDFTLHYFESAYQSVLQIFGVSSMHIVAESQATPVALVLGRKLKDRVRNIVLMRPLGFSVQAYGATPEERFKTFRRRIVRTSLQYRQSPLYDPRNVIAALTLMRAMMREPTLQSLNKKYIAGISYDAVKDLERTAEMRHLAGNHVTLVLGGKDKMFPAQEVLETLKRSHIPHVTTIVLPKASHSPISIRDSQKVLKTSLRVARGR